RLKRKALRHPLTSPLQYPFQFIGVTGAFHKTLTIHLLDRKAAKLESHLVCVKRRAVRREHHDDLANRVDDRAKVLLTLLELPQQHFVLGNVHCCSEEPFKSCALEYGSPKATYIANLSVGSQTALGEIESSLVLKQPLECPFHEFTVFRRHQIQVLRNCRRLGRGVETIDSGQFGRPIIEPFRVEGPASHMG